MHLCFIAQHIRNIFACDDAPEPMDYLASATYALMHSYFDLNVCY